MGILRVLQEFNNNLKTSIIQGIVYKYPSLNIH